MNLLHKFQPWSDFRVGFSLDITKSPYYIIVMWEVLESRLCTKQVRKAPNDVVKQYEAWKAVVVCSGPPALRQITGYRDHALKGGWKGARSSYLTKKWRVLYVVERKRLQVLVLEVNPHEY